MVHCICCELKILTKESYLKNLILVFFIILSSWAQANMSYESGQYYAQKGSISSVCGKPFVDGYGVCVVPCQEAQWYQDCGGDL